MVVVNYKSKRKLKKAIGEELKQTHGAHLINKSFFATNMNRTFIAVVITDEHNIIQEVR